MRLFLRCVAVFGSVFPALLEVGVAAVTSADIAHKADFLTNPDCGAGTTAYMNATAARRAQCRAGIKKRGYTHHYVSVASDIRNHYSDPEGFKRKLQELVADGIKPVLWLTSDTGSWRNKPLGAIKQDLTNFIPHVDRLVSSYSLGIEIDEYWTRAEAREIAKHLRTLTMKKIAAHQRAGRWDYCKDAWCDYMILQYGFGRSDSIIPLTRAAMQDLKKPVIAGEYNARAPERHSIRLGDAGIRAGAAGFGNGGTP